MEKQPLNLKQNFLRRKQVEAKTGLARSSIYARMTLDPRRPKQFDPTFPRPVRLGARCVAWLETEVDDWMAAQVGRRDGGGS